MKEQTGTIGPDILGGLKYFTVSWADAFVFPWLAQEGIEPRTLPVFAFISHRNNLIQMFDSILQRNFFPVSNFLENVFFKAKPNKAEDRRQH